MLLAPDEVLRVAGIAVIALAGGALGWWVLARWAQRNRAGADAAVDEPGAVPGDQVGVAVARRAPPAVRVASAVVTAGLWAVLMWRIGVDPMLPAVLAFAAASTVLAIVDVLEQRLPNRVTGPASVAVGVLLVVASGVTGDWPALSGALLGSAAMFTGFLLVALVAPPAMGMGDVKLAGLVGLLLGWFGVDAWLIGLAAGFVLGGLVAVIALALRRVRLRGSIPFGPSMLAGAVVAVLVT